MIHETTPGACEPVNLHLSSNCDACQRRALSNPVAHDTGDDDALAIAGDAQIGGSGEKNHRARMFVDRGFVGNLLDVNTKEAAGREIDCLGMHQIAVEKNFDPVTILGNSENDAGGILDRRKACPAWCSRAAPC